MSDTLQTVRWSLGNDSEPAGHLWPPPGRERPNEALWDSVRRTGLEAQLRRAFQLTDPLWYGLWIGSPLTNQQCTLLHTLFSDLVASIPRYREHFQQFLDALKRSTETGESLNVELTPPGHVDLGWITTFVHCPRCKAEGPVERWQESYADNPIRCPVCGHSYCPAATYSAERDYFAETVSCRTCNASYRVKKFSEDDIRILEHHHDYREACRELVRLRRVATFHKR